MVVELDKMADGMLSLAWNNHSSTFTHMLSTVRYTESYTDVTIACEGKFYPAHKLVLSTCSDYFLEIFEKTPCKHPVIVIKDMDCKNMEALLNYMYRGLVNINQNDLAQLIKAAELLKIKGLAIPDEPPSGNKRILQTRDTCMDSGNPVPKRSRQVEKRISNQHETLIEDPCVALSQSSSSRRDESMDEHSEEINPVHIKTELGQDEEQSASRSDVQGSEQGMEHLPTSGGQNEVESETGIKEEKIKVENDGEATDVGYENDGLMGLVMDGGGGGGESKEHSTSVQSLSHLLNAESYSAEAGPSGLQTWPVHGDGVESAGPGYTGGLTMSSHQGQQPHQMQHMVLETSDLDGGCGIVGLKSHKMHHCPYCPYSADFNYLLLRHIRTHTGEKPYWCPKCSYRASRKDSLKQHMTTHIPLGNILNDSE